MSDIAGASTWVVSAAKLARSTSPSAATAGFGLDRSPILKLSAPTELIAWRASGKLEIEARVGERGLQQCAGRADGLVELTGHAAALLEGAERGEPLDPLGAALLNPLDLVDLVADQLEEAGHHLAQRRIEQRQRIGDRGDVGLELGALVGVVDHPQEGAVAVAALGVPCRLVVGVHLALPVAVLDVGVDRLVEGGGGLLDHRAVLADVGDQPFHLHGDGAGLVVGVGDVGCRALAGIEFVEFGMQRGDFGLDALADAGRVVADLEGDVLEARRDAVDGAAGGDGVVAAHAADEVQRAAGVLGEVADVLVASACVDDAVQPALAGPRLDQRQPRLRVIEVVEVAFQPDHQLGLGGDAAGQVTLHQRGVEAEVGGGQQPHRAGTLHVAVQLEQVGGRLHRRVVHLAPSIRRVVRTPQHRARRGHLRARGGECRGVSRGVCDVCGQRDCSVL